MSEPQVLTPESPIVSPLVTTERSPSKPQSTRRVAAPDDRRAAGAAGPARAREAREPARRAGHAVEGAAVVLARIGVVQGRAARAVGGAGVERRVLAEVLHPAVVAVGHGLAQQPAVEVAAGPGGEVELRDVEARERAVAVHVRLARRVLDERAAGRRLAEARVGGADHRVEVGGHGEPGAVEARHARALGLLAAGLVGARQVVRVGLGHRQRRVARAATARAPPASSAAAWAGTRGRRRTARTPRAGGRRAR